MIVAGLSAMAAILNGSAGPPFMAVAAATATTCLAAGVCVGASGRWTNAPGLLATAIAAVLVATSGAVGIGRAMRGVFGQPQLGAAVLAGLAIAGIACFLFAVGASLGGGAASLVRRSSPSVAVTGSQL